MSVQGFPHHHTNSLQKDTVDNLNIAIIDEEIEEDVENIDEFKRFRRSVEEESFKEADNL